MENFWVFTLGGFIKIDKEVVYWTATSYSNFNIPLNVDGYHVILKDKNGNSLRLSEEEEMGYYNKIRESLNQTQF